MKELLTLITDLNLIAMHGMIETSSQCSLKPLHVQIELSDFVAEFTFRIDRLRCSVSVYLSLQRKWCLLFHTGGNFAYQKVAAILFLLVQVNPHLINHIFVFPYLWCNLGFSQNMFLLLDLSPAT